MTARTGKGTATIASRTRARRKAKATAGWMGTMREAEPRGGSSGRRLQGTEARRAAIGTHLLRGRRGPRAVDRVSDDPGSVAATIKVNRGLEIVGRMGDDAKKAGGVSRRGISAAKEGRHLTRSS